MMACSLNANIQVLRKSSGTWMVSDHISDPSRKIKLILAVHVYSFGLKWTNRFRSSSLFKLCLWSGCWYAQHFRARTAWPSSELTVLVCAPSDRPAAVASLPVCYIPSSNILLEIYCCLNIIVEFTNNNLMAIRLVLTRRSHLWSGYGFLSPLDLILRELSCSLFAYSFTFNWKEERAAGRLFNRS